MGRVVTQRPICGTMLPQSIPEDVFLTTSYVVANREIAHELDIVSADCVLGLNLFKGLFVGVRDLLGGRSSTFQTAMRDARESCFVKLRRDALRIGADAVIAISISYNEISRGVSILMVTATWTAVNLKKTGSEIDPTSGDALQE